jgi:cell division protein FtsB
MEHDEIKRTNYRKKPGSKMTTTGLLWIIFLVAVLILGSLCAYVVNDNRVLSDQREQNEALTLRKKQLTEQKRDLESRNEYLRSQPGIVRSARENGYVMPGERLIVIQKEKDKAKNSDKKNKKD